MSEKAKFPFAEILGAGIAITIIGSALLLILVVVPAYFEAKTYNKLTGANASTWDAMWVELRVQAEPKEGK